VIDAWVHGYLHNCPHQSLAMATAAMLFRPAPIDVVPPVPVATEPLVPETVDVLVAPRRQTTSRTDRKSGTDKTVDAAEWEAVLTPRARLLLPSEQQFKFTAALARLEVTVWAV
jgi:hypothetical protein